MEATTHTKANLIKAKSMREFSLRGFELLDKKRNVLIRELMELISESKELEKKLDEKYQSAFKALQVANITLSSNVVHDLSYSIPTEKEFDMLYRSVMGVEIPKVVYKEAPIETSYGFYRSNPSFDTVVREFDELKYLVYSMCELENAVFKLVNEIKKTQKRANSLEKIQIPKFTKLIKAITETLEEKEREDFFRLKMIKKRK